jgi:protein arginine N-methyltransferase 1
MGFIPMPYHHTMLEDRNRMAALERAIAAKVKPGDVVFDVGAGTGILSFFAAKQARKVYAVEADPAVAKVGQRLIELNGLGSKVEYTHGLAQDHIPPEPVDVIICEMMHVALAVEQQIPVMNAVLEGLQQRHAGHASRVIPEEAVNYCQLIQADWNRSGYIAPFVRLGSPYGADPTVTALSQITKYSSHLFDRVNPTHIEGRCTISADTPGTVNAVRILTQTVLDFDESKPPQERANTWFMHYMVLPLEQAWTVQPGAEFEATFNYEAGCNLDELRFEVRKR